jgi:hypothetical protein
VKRWKLSFSLCTGNSPPGYPDSTKPETRLKAFCAAVHGLKEKRAALCISGGGIRSAAFGLGILQGLARCSVLDKFHYLSTVSGGGYIGAWLSAWIHRADGGLMRVVWELALRPVARLGPEPTEISRLRLYANYLNREIGLLSTDTWRLIATYLRNITAMSLVLVPLLAAALTIPWLYAAMVVTNPTYTSMPYGSVLPALLSELPTWASIYLPAETSAAASAAL